jgi:hypothetical protein
MSNYSRRDLAGLFPAFFFRPRRGANHAMLAAQSPPSMPTQPPEPRSQACHYRADASILLLGITILRIRGVGGGQASLEETGDGASTRTTLFFAAGSDPKRAHGLNRMGWIREIVLGAGPAPSEASYFGVMTSSPEESLEHARKSIEAPPSGKSVYSAVSGRNTPGHSRSALAHFEFPNGAGWSDPHLIEEAKSRFHGNAAWRETSWPNSPDSTPPTFLFALATLLRQRAKKRATGRYVYNEQEYLLELDAAPQNQFHGKIRNLRTGHQTTFAIWVGDSEGSIVPVRIEYQARAFLRLTFEAVPA